MFPKRSSKVNPNFKCNSYFDLSITFLKCAGCYPIFHITSPRGVHERAYNFLGHLYSIILFLNLIHMAVSQIISIALRGGSIMEISIYLRELVNAFTVMTFQIVFYFHQEKFLILIESFNRRIVNRSVVGITFVTMQRPYEFSKNFTLIWTIMALLATLHYSLNPILDGEKRLPVPVMYPFDVMESPYFEIEFCLQTLAQMQYGFAYSIIVAIITTVTMLLCGQLDILYCSIHNLMYAAMIRRGGKRSIEMVKYLQINWKYQNKDRIRYCFAIECFEDLDCLHESSVGLIGPESDLLEYRAYDTEVMEILKNCIRHHQYIIEMAHSVENIFSSFLFLELVQHTLFICIVTYGLSIHPQLDNMFFHFVFYFCMVNFDTFLIFLTPHLMAEQVKLSNHNDGEEYLTKFVHRVRSCLPQ